MEATPRYTRGSKAAECDGAEQKRYDYRMTVTATRGSNIKEAFGLCIFLNFGAA
ncbi:MAG: hypothetical protein ACI4QX_02330 [Lachnospiraceae bacterium]